MNAPLPAHLLPAADAAPGAGRDARRRCASASASAAPPPRRCASSTAATSRPFPVTPPEVVVFCESTDDVAAVVALAAAHAVPVIPFGVGSSLEGHLLAVQGGVSIDLSRMDRVAARQRRGPDGHRAGRRDARAAQPRDHATPGLFFPIDPGANAIARRHGRHARQRHQRGALRHDARERARPDRGHRQRRDHPHRHARAQEQRRLRPDAPVRRQRRHAGRDDRGHAQALPAARGGERGDLPLPEHRRRGAARRSR